MNYIKEMISILLPVYNVEEYLEQCLDSIYVQDYKNFEIIAVNDGSTDNSLEILNKYKTFFKGKLKIFSTENRGLPCARNLALKHSNGEFIYHMDSDDYIQSNTLSRCINFFKEKNVDIVAFNASAFCDETYINEDMSKYDYTRAIKPGVYNTSEFFDMSIKTNYIVQVCCFMLRRDSLGNIKFPENIIHEDIYYATKVLLNNNFKVFVTDESFFSRRLRAGSIMTKKFNHKNLNGHLTVCKLLYLELANEKNEKNRKNLNKIIFSTFNQAIDIESSISNGIPITKKTKYLKYLTRYGFDSRLALKILFNNLYVYLKRMKG